MSKATYVQGTKIIVESRLYDILCHFTVLSIYFSFTPWSSNNYPGTLSCVPSPLHPNMTPEESLLRGILLAAS